MKFVGFLCAFLISVGPVSAAPAPVGHVLSDTRSIESRFQNVLKTRTEYRAMIELEKGGLIEIIFFPETAPNHVASFVALARKGFYNGVTFHRVLPGFMAQTGDPTGTGSGGPGYSVNAEFSNLPHVRGTVSMARGGDPLEQQGLPPRPQFANSGGSQFFICLASSSFLNGKYTIFGEVVKGMDVVDKIRLRDPNQNPNFTGDAIKRITIIESWPASSAGRGRPRPHPGARPAHRAPRPHGSNMTPQTMASAKQLLLACAVPAPAATAGHVVINGYAPIAAPSAIRAPGPVPAPRAVPGAVVVPAPGSRPGYAPIPGYVPIRVCT